MHQNFNGKGYMHISNELKSNRNFFLEAVRHRGNRMEFASEELKDDKDFVILQNHGILTTGTMVDTTIWYFLNMEDACKSQLLAEAVGKPIVIPHDTACATRDYVANDLSAYVSFQPTIDVLWEEEPDLLD